jgi:hypothetical protein
MLPLSYQKNLQKHLSASQYLTLELLVMLIQCHRQVSLSFLSSVFPQPIQYRSRKRNLQRFLVLPQLSIRLLWFPLLKYWLRQEESGIGLNRAQRRHRKKLTFRKFGYWLVAIDRTEWKGRNVFMVSLVWGTHALPLDWEVLDHVGNSDLRTQKRLLTAILPLFKRAKLLVLTDRESHSPKLADWLSRKGLSFALQQKKSLHFTEEVGTDYQSLASLNLKAGMSKFYAGVFCNKQEGLGPFNIALYWKRSYRKKGLKEAWYILSNQPDLKMILAVYRCRWGIEQLFKDCKSGGYNLEDTKLNNTRFMALLLIIVIAYGLATIQGYSNRQSGLDSYMGRLQEHKDKTLRQSDFSLGLYGQRWGYAMALCPDLVLDLISLKPHKSLYFQRGFLALSLIQQAS